MFPSSLLSQIVFVERFAKNLSDAPVRKLCVQFLNGEEIIAFLTTWPRSLPSGSTESWVPSLWQQGLVRGNDVPLHCAYVATSHQCFCSLGRSFCNSSRGFRRVWNTSLKIAWNCKFSQQPQIFDLWWHVQPEPGWWFQIHVYLLSWILTCNVLIPSEFHCVWTTEDAPKSMSKSSVSPLESPSFGSIWGAHALSKTHHDIPLGL